MTIEPQAILAAMASMDRQFLIIDEILFVATTRFGLKLNHTTLTTIFDELEADGEVIRETNAFGQNCYKLNPKTDLKALLAEVDAIMGASVSPTPNLQKKVI